MIWRRNIRTPDMPRAAYRLALVIIAAVAFLVFACGGDDDLILATTTSTYDSGLLDELVPLFEQESGRHVKVIAVGTGRALEMGRRGDADVLLVHAPSSEEEFMAGGYGINRQRVMYNDFVIVGPDEDPVNLRGAEDATTALHAVQKSLLTFFSRGDDSGTHKRELALWEALGVDPTGEPWYRETGQGMGETLQIANQLDGYTLTDRGTYLALGDAINLAILHEGDERLLNIYHAMQVDPDRHSGVNGDAAADFVAFMVSDVAQSVIEGYGVDEYGEPLFVPYAE